MWQSLHPVLAIKSEEREKYYKPAIGWLLQIEQDVPFCLRVIADNRMKFWENIKIAVTCAHHELYYEYCPRPTYSPHLGLPFVTNREDLDWRVQ